MSRSKVLKIDYAQYPALFDCLKSQKSEKIVCFRS